MKVDKKIDDEEVSFLCGKRLALLVVLLLGMVESLKVRLVGKMGLNILELGRRPIRSVRLIRPATIQSLCTFPDWEYSTGKFSPLW